MHRFYVDSGAISGDTITITNSDVNHIKNVLRLTRGESLIIYDGERRDFSCIIESIDNNEVLLKIIDSYENETELPGKVYLFQGIPKKDKMELIIQKSVELGVYEIVPVTTKRTIVKIRDKKRENKKIERWQSIATSAAKQSIRGIIPKIHSPMTFTQAIDYGKNLEFKLIPYEKARDIKATRDIIHGIKDKKSIGIFIGPEGGFDEDEINHAKNNDFISITLGKRILRTETAAIALISMIMLELEK